MNWHFIILFMARHKLNLNWVCSKMKTTEEVFYPLLFFTRLFGIHPFPQERTFVRYLSQAYSAAMLSAAGVVVTFIARDIHMPNSSIVDYENLVMKLCALIFSVLILLTIVAVFFCNLFRAGHFMSLFTDLDFVADELRCEKIYVYELQKVMTASKIMYVYNEHVI